MTTETEGGPVHAAGIAAIRSAAATDVEPGAKMLTPPDERYVEQRLRTDPKDVRKVLESMRKAH